MSGRQEGRARSSRAYAHDRTEHGRHSRTLRASVPDLSHVPRKRAGRPREVLRRVRLSPTGIGDASEAPHRAITLPTRSAEPRAQRERTLPICYSPAGRTQRPLPTVRDAMAEKCRKVIVTGLVETHFRTARCAPTVKPHVPSTAASGIAQPCRLDGCSHTCRLRAPIQVRCKTRKANEHSRYMRVMRLVNQRRLSRQTDEVDKSSAHSVSWQPRTVG